MRQHKESHVSDYKREPLFFKSKIIKKSNFFKYLHGNCIINEN